MSLKSKTGVTMSRLNLSTFLVIVDDDDNSNDSDAYGLSSSILAAGRHLG